MKKIENIFKILILIILILLVLKCNIYAEQTIDTNISIGTTTAINSSTAITARIVGIIQVVGSVIAVLALVIIGFRYMISSVDEKASMKGVLVYYVIGAVLVFATSNILSMVYNVVYNLNF